ncbi:hypothetical protein Ancab_004935 [Ancistrocladus abbreviatus]
MMATVIHQVLVMLLSAGFLASAQHLKLPERADPSDLPCNFLFGAASSAYQYEGAYISDGKGLNNWDVFTHKSGRIIDGSNGDVATDHYHRYKEDVDLMANLGVNSYRFSISWARILPVANSVRSYLTFHPETEGRYGDINFAGIHFYNNLIDALLEKEIEPFVKLSHYDIPQELEDRYGGWLSPKLKEDFGYYADVCFKFLGDRVKYWVTFNEPNIVTANGYRTGEYPPGRCLGPYWNCTEGDSEKEPFIVAHNIILAHAVAVNLYRKKYQEEQGGFIGIVLSTVWFEPMTNSSADKLAAERGASRTEGLCLINPCKNGIPIGEPTAMEWFQIYPQGMKNVVSYVKARYNNTPIFITENGYAHGSSHNSSTEELLKDFKRVEYIEGYLEALLGAIR